MYPFGQSGPFADFLKGLLNCPRLHGRYGVFMLANSGAPPLRFLTGAVIGTNL